MKTIKDSIKIHYVALLDSCFDTSFSIKTSAMKMNRDLFLNRKKKIGHNKDKKIRGTSKITLNMNKNAYASELWKRGINKENVSHSAPVKWDNCLEI